MQSRTFLRIEGDLVSLVTEVIDREVTLPDLLTELTTAQVATHPSAADRLPLLDPLGDDRPSGLRRRAAPDRGGRSSTTPADAETASRPPIGSPCRTSSSSSRRSANRSRGCPRTSGRSRSRRSTRRSSRSTLPNTNDDGIVCLGSVRVSGASVGERVDALIGAFWASRFNQDLRRHPLPFSGGFRAWASRSRRDPLAALSLQYDPYWRTLRQVVAQMAGLAITDLPAGTPVPDEPSESEVLTPDPDVGGETDAIAS